MNILRRSGGKLVNMKTDKGFVRKIEGKPRKIRPLKIGEETSILLKYGQLCPMLMVLGLSVH